VNTSLSHGGRARPLLGDQVGSGFIQNVVLVAALALATAGAVKGLAGRMSDKLDCTGSSITSLANVPCTDDGAGDGQQLAVVAIPPPPPPPAPPPPEPPPPPSNPVGDFFGGFFAGDFTDCESVACTSGQIISGFIPIFGDVRDTVAAGVHCAAGEDCSDLLLAGVGFIPFVGDIAKGADKAAEGLGKVDEVVDLGGAAGRRDPSIPKTPLGAKPNESFFWSGSTDGIGGVERAAELARAGGGKTLEDLLRERGIPEPTTMDGWIELSRQFAQEASGEVRAVVGESTRPNSVWESVELPALMNNPNVTKITIIDPKTGAETVIYQR
jgi:hypothetical protein